LLSVPLARLEFLAQPGETLPNLLGHRLVIGGSLGSRRSRRRRRACLSGNGRGGRSGEHGRDQAKTTLHLQSPWFSEKAGPATEREVGLR
jgi:hypothetical protein